MAGMDMMLKSLGIDPDKIRGYAESISTGIQQFDARLTEVEKELKIISAQNSRILELLGDKPNEPTGEPGKRQN